MVSYPGAGPQHGLPEDDPFYAYAYPGSSDTSRGNVALLAQAVPAESQTIGQTIDFVDAETPIEDAIVP